MARYLITGVAGFIGSSLAHELLQQGHDVRGIDDLSCGSLSNLDGIAADIDFRLGDINNATLLHDSCRDVEYVLHQAAIASVPRSVRDPMASHQANINGTLNVLLAARNAGVSRVVYAASSSAYGDQPTQPKHEGMLPCPLSPYAVQKLTGEQYVKSFWHVYGLEGVCLRYFNVFGPKQGADSPYSGVIARFISDMLQGTVPTICGTGHQSRDFTFISNVVSANLLACSAPRELVTGEVFNVGTGTSQTLNALYMSLADLLGFSGDAVYGSQRVGDVEHSQADVSKAIRCLGYKPLTSFTEGLSLTVRWYVDQLSHVSPGLPLTSRDHSAYAMIPS